MLQAARAIEARERLASILDFQVGSGTAKRGISLRHLRQLNRAAGVGSRQAGLSELTAFGIKVEHRG